MLRYSPPKSSIWGHRLGRLSCVQVFERSARFLSDQTIIQDVPKVDVTANWINSQSGRASSRIESLANALALSPNEMAPGNGYNGEVYHNIKWTVPLDALAIVAAWLDETAAQSIPESELLPSTCMYLHFRWKEDVSADPTTNRMGGMFGIHLGRVRGITTMFSFRSREHYEAVKKYLTEIRLVQLSDKHLRHEK